MKEVWDKSLPGSAYVGPGNDSFSTQVRDQSKQHGIIFTITLRSIWGARNKVISQNEDTSNDMILARVHVLMNQTVAVFQKMDHNMVCEATLVSWLLPSQDLVAMNVDGRVLGDPSRLGFGGLG